MMQKHMIVVPVSAREGISAADVAAMLDRLINVGLADAQSTLEDKDCDPTAAEQVLDINLSSPRPLDQTEAMRLLDEADSYLRDLRAENLDGSEPALRELLDRVEVFWVAQNAKPAAPATLVEQLAALKAAGLGFSDCVKAFAAPNDNPFVAQARVLVMGGEDDIALDDDVVLAESPEGDGARALAWIWISNDEAGVKRPPELLEDVLDHAMQRLGDDHPVVDVDAETLLGIQADWLEDLITNFSDELDGIAKEVVTREPGPVVWVDISDASYTFLPSEALTQLIKLAREGGLDDSTAKAAEAFCAQYGRKLDAVLTVIQTA